jgi:peptide deformylase
MRQLVTIDNDIKNVLRTCSNPVTIFGKRLRPVIDNMFAVMEEHQGAGLAAPQIGVLQRIIIVGRTVMMNPIIVQTDEKIQFDDEGCLSIPNVKVKIKRYNSVAVAYLDIKRSQRIDWFRDIGATIAQHEIDHINGKLMIDHAAEF